jgi:hypothetical protein
MKLFVPNAVDPFLLAQQGEEVWSPLGGNSPYFVSNLGRVYTVGHKEEGEEGRIVEPCVNKKTGHKTITLRGKRYGAGYRVYVHLLVFSTFCPGSSGPVRHLNGDSGDDRLCNLTQTGTKGRLSEEKKVAVVAALKSGKTQAQVAREFGMSPSHVNYYAKKLTGPKVDEHGLV